MAVDYLGAICGRLAGRRFPSRLLAAGHQARVLVDVPDFNKLLQQAFDLPRISARGNHALFRRMLRALAVVGQQAISDDRKNAVVRQARLTLAFAEQTLMTEYEKQSVQTLYQHLASAWECSGAGAITNINKEIL